MYGVGLRIEGVSCAGDEFELRRPTGAADDVHGAARREYGILRPVDSKYWPGWQKAGFIGAVALSGHGANRGDAVASDAGADDDRPSERVTDKRDSADTTAS